MNQRARSTETLIGNTCSSEPLDEGAASHVDAPASTREQLLEASRSAAARGVYQQSESGIEELAERIANRKTGSELLEEWLAAPGTKRAVKRLVYTGGHFEIELSAGGFIYESKTQQSLEGAFRNVLAAAAFDE